MSPCFRQVADAEIAAAYSIYLGVVDWLKARGVRQWLRVLPEDEFLGRQARGELFAGYVEDRMAAIVTVALEEDPDWTECVGTDKNWWIKTLAVSRAFGGRDLGTQMMSASEVHATRAGAKAIHLECVVGFLPGYYTRCGYEELKRKSITYPSGNTFLVALMRKNLA